MIYCFFGVWEANKSAHKLKNSFNNILTESFKIWEYAHYAVKCSFMSLALQREKTFLMLGLHTNRIPGQFLFEIFRDLSWE